MCTTDGGKGKHLHACKNPNQAEVDGKIKRMPLDSVRITNRSPLYFNLLGLLLSLLMLLFFLFTWVFFGLIIQLIS